MKYFVATVLMMTVFSVQATVCKRGDLSKHKEDLKKLYLSEGYMLCSSAAPIPDAGEIATVPTSGSVAGPGAVHPAEIEQVFTQMKTQCDKFRSALDSEGSDPDSWTGWWQNTSQHLCKQDFFMAPILNTTRIFMAVTEKETARRFLSMGVLKEWVN